MIDSNPPLLPQYGALLHHPAEHKIHHREARQTEAFMEAREVPLINLSQLRSEDEAERLSCAAEISRASSEWGFFQVVNHGVSPELLAKMRREQVKLFQKPFEWKSTCGLLDNSYRWGSPLATRIKELSWSEAFHIPLSRISDQACYGEFTSLREAMQEVATAMSMLAMLLAGVLAEGLGHEKGLFEQKCKKSTCFLRLNHYPPCTVSPQIFGLVPHTDSDFLTILSQDQVGGLQLMKDSKWVAVKPRQDALIVNIGDLFQAWSNDVYKSVEHKVMVNDKTDRHTVAYFLCPSRDSSIGSCSQPSLYRNFTFGEYRDQVQQDVKQIGQKIGLPRFLL